MKVFFFQAEVGIRDVAVTGVQTCALPHLLRQPVRSALRCGARLSQCLSRAARSLGLADRARVCQPRPGRRPALEGVPDRQGARRRRRRREGVPCRDGGRGRRAHQEAARVRRARQALAQPRLRLLGDAALDREAEAHRARRGRPHGAKGARRVSHRGARWLCLLLFPALVGCTVFERARSNWWELERGPSGQAPDPAGTPEPVVQVYAARAVSWRGVFAVHTWIAVKPSGAASWTRYEVIGWALDRG